MDRKEQTTDYLRWEMTALVKSKFTPPYLNDEQRKGVDALIFKIWKELENRKAPKFVVED